MHVKKHPKVYIFTFSIFIIGILMGHFTINGLLLEQKQELQNYIQGFMKIFDIEKVDNIEVFNVSLFREVKQVVVLWALGASIIGIPLIFMIVFFRGFTLGFTLGIIGSALGSKGLFTILSIILLKELLIVTVLMSLSVNGIVFSTDIISSLLGKKFLLGNIKIKFLRYTIFAGIQLVVIGIAVALEAVFLPVFIKV
jgi:stage II sporulation protein M